MDRQNRVRDVYAASRTLYIIEALTEHFISLLTTGVFLATLTKELGISDALTAILSSIVSLSGLFQIVTIFISHKTPVKRWVIPLQLISHTMMAALYLIPVLNIKRGAGLIFFLLYIGSNAIKRILAPAKTNWFFSLVATNKRGSFSSVLTAVSVIGQIFFTLGASYALDSFIAVGNQRGAFALIAGVIFVLIVLDIIPLFISKEKPENREKAPSPFASLKKVFSNRGYRIFIIITTIHAIGTGLTVPFLGTYQINELNFSLSYIAIIDIVINVIWIASLFIFGRMSHKRSYAFIRRIATFFHILAFCTLIFTNPANGMVLFVIYRAFYFINQGGTAVTTNGLIFDLSSPETRTDALAIQTMITGTVSFVTTLIATPIFEHLQKNHAVIFGAEMQAQQVLSIATFAIILVVNVLWWIFYKHLDVKH